MDSFQLKNKYGYINISDDELSDVALLSSEMLQHFINDFLRSGFPIPIPKGFLLTTNLLITTIRITHTD